MVKENGGVGAIVASSRFLDVAMIFMAPGTLVNYTVGEKIYEYINKTRYIFILLSRIPILILPNLLGIIPT